MMNKQQRERKAREQSAQLKDVPQPVQTLSEEQAERVQGGFAVKMKPVYITSYQTGGSG